MKHTKKVVVPETTREVLDFIVCDLCEEKAFGGDWAEGSYRVSRTSVSMEDGDSYPEGGNIIKTSYDICPECFENKLMPWLAEQGAMPAEIESDW